MCDVLGVCIFPLIMVDVGKGAVERAGQGWGDGQEHGAGAKNMLAVSEVLSSSSGAGGKGRVLRQSGVGVMVGLMPVS